MPRRASPRDLPSKPVRALRALCFLPRTSPRGIPRIENVLFDLVTPGGRKVNEIAVVVVFDETIAVERTENVSLEYRRVRMLGPSKQVIGGDCGFRVVIQKQQNLLFIRQAVSQNSFLTSDSPNLRDGSHGQTINKSLSLL